VLRYGALRNPLADPFTLGVSGAHLWASVAIAFGLGLNLVGVPFIFIAAFVGAAVSILFVYRLARSGGGVMLPGALLLAGVAEPECFSGRSRNPVSRGVRTGAANSALVDWKP
jgi:iron complex transport system permease protein